MQRAPRDSSTLIIANAVGHLQALREGLDPDDGGGALFKVFVDHLPATAIGSIVLEQAWSAPEGVGEICLFDNRFVLHASYYRAGRGYPIGVRYLI